MNKEIPKIPKEYLEKEENIISLEESLKDVIPVDWDEIIVKETDEEYKKISTKKKKTNNKKESKK